MNFKIREYNEDLPNNPDALAVMVEKVNAVMAEQALIFSHMVIDGEAVYEEPLHYIEQNIADIYEVEAVLQTESAYMAQLLFELHHVLAQAIPQIVAIGKLFVQNNSQEIWNELESFLNEMGILVQLYNEVAAQSQVLRLYFAHINWPDIENHYNLFTGGLAGMSTFVECKDTVMMADLLLYEIVPALENIYNAIERFTGKEVKL